MIRRQLKRPLTKLLHLSWVNRLPDGTFNNGGTTMAACKAGISLWIPVSSNLKAVPVKKYVLTRAGVWNWLGGDDALFSDKDPKNGRAISTVFVQHVPFGFQYLYWCKQFSQILSLNITVILLLKGFLIEKRRWNT